MRVPYLLQSSPCPTELQLNVQIFRISTTIFEVPGSFPWMYYLPYLGCVFLQNCWETFACCCVTSKNIEALRDVWENACGFSYSSCHPWKPQQSESLLFTEKITNRRRKQNEALRDLAWAAAAMVMPYRGLFPGCGGFKRSHLTLQECVEQHVTSLDTHHQRQWLVQSCNEKQVGWV